MEIDKYLIGLVIFGFMIGGGLVLINDAVDQGNIATDEDNSSRLLTILSNNATKETYGIAKDWDTDIDGSEVENEQAENSLFRNALLTTKKIRNSFDISNQMLNAVALEFSIAEVIRDLFYYILIIGIVSAIIFLLWRFQPR